MTTLRPYHDPKSGNVRRVYVRRPGLSATLWFEKSKLWDASFDVRFDGSRGQFSVNATGVQVTGGEAPHIAEARVALAEMGLEMTSCTWSEIVERAKKRPQSSRSLLTGWLPFLGRRWAS